MGMPERAYTPLSGGYRYGFNGKENDNEVKGNGNQQDYGMRIYDPRLGRFLSVDPLAQEFPWYSPYQFAGNKPIEAIDLDGAEEFYVNQQNLVKQRAVFEAINKEQQAARVADPLGLKDIKKRIVQNGNLTTVGPDKSTWYSRRQSELRKAQAAKEKAIQGATMDPLAGAIAYNSLNTAKDYVQGVVGHGENLINGINEGDGWKIAGNVVLLGLDAAPAGPLIRSASLNTKIGDGILSAGDVLRIENAATRIGKPITVIGSRARGTAGAYSDWDYVIEGLKNSTWKKIKNSLPGSKSVMDNLPRNIDLHKPPVRVSEPHFTIKPK